MFILTCIYEKEGVQAKQNHLSFLKKKKKKSYKMSLKSVQPCFCYGHINNVKPDLDLEKGHDGKGQGRYPYFILCHNLQLLSKVH